MTLFALGPEGTFSHELACRLVPPDQVRLLPAIGLICKAVESGEGDGIIPVENSEAGAVGPTMDGLLRYNISITGEMYMEIHHHLASFLPLSEIAVVYAHPQSGEQCSDVLDKLGVQVVFTGSNAASAIELINHPDAAAVISRRIADLYLLPVIRSNIENNPHNVTRFIRISLTAMEETGSEKCSIAIDPAIDRPGLLYDLLGVFARRGINLSRIESRPSKRGMGNYVFFIDITRTPDFAEAMAELGRITQIKPLGCYRRIEVPP
jgi:prephenate dehydratase